MAKLSILRATTSKIVRFFVQDASRLDGGGLTGLVYNSAGLTAYYIKEGDNSTTAITLASGTLGTWSSGGFIAVDATHMPGVYELGLPNAALASGNSTLLFIQGATNMVPIAAEVQVDGINYATGNINAAVQSYAAGQDPASLLLATPANKLFTSAAGLVQLDMTQTVPVTNTAQTMGDALNAARVQAFGKWVLVGTTLTLYNSDNTVARTFSLDSATAPTQRT